MSNEMSIYRNLVRRTHRVFINVNKLITPHRISNNIPNLSFQTFSYFTSYKQIEAYIFLVRSTFPIKIIRTSRIYTHLRIYKHGCLLILYLQNCVYS